MKMLKLFVAGVAAMQLVGCGVSSVTECTTEPQSSWLDQQQFQDGLKAKGYKITEFKVTEGNCYEIYGHNSEGKKVEIYFNPVDGAVVKQEMK